MAKKRKPSKPSASSRKKKAPKTSTRRVVTKKAPTGLESTKHVDFRPLKTHLRAHIERLGQVKDPSPAVANALKSLREVSAALTAECSPSMIIPTS